jgi:DNA-binding ferritin-like protein
MIVNFLSKGSNTDGKSARRRKYNNSKKPCPCNEKSNKDSESTNCNLDNLEESDSISSNEAIMIDLIHSSQEATTTSKNYQGNNNTITKETDTSIEICDSNSDLDFLQSNQVIETEDLNKYFDEHIEFGNFDAFEVSCHPMRQDTLIVPKSKSTADSDVFQGISTDSDSRFPERFKAESFGDIEFTNDKEDDVSNTDEICSVFGPTRFDDNIYDNSCNMYQVDTINKRLLTIKAQPILAEKDIEKEAPSKRKNKDYNKASEILRNTLAEKSHSLTVSEKKFLKELIETKGFSNDAESVQDIEMASATLQNNKLFPLLANSQKSELALDKAVDNNPELINNEEKKTEKRKWDLNRKGELLTPYDLIHSKGSIQSDISTLTSVTYLSEPSISCSNQPRCEEKVASYRSANVYRNDVVHHPMTDNTASEVLTRYDGWVDYVEADLDDDISQNCFKIIGTFANDPSCKPHVLSPPLMEALQGFLPYSLSQNNFWLKYSLVRDVSMISDFLNHIFQLSLFSIFQKPILLNKRGPPQSLFKQSVGHQIKL